MHTSDIFKQYKFFLSVHVSKDSKIGYFSWNFVSKQNDKYRYSLNAEFLYISHFIFLEIFIEIFALYLLLWTAYFNNWKMTLSQGRHMNDDHER